MILSGENEVEKLAIYLAHQIERYADQVDQVDAQLMSRLLHSYLDEQELAIVEKDWNESVIAVPKVSASS